MNRALPMVGVGRASPDEVPALTVVGDTLVAAAPADVVPACASPVAPAGTIRLCASTGDEDENALAYVRRTLRIVTAPVGEVHARRQPSADASTHPVPW